MTEQLLYRLPEPAVSTHRVAQCTFDVPLMRPLLPSGSALQPYLKRIDEARWYTNFGPLSVEFEARIAEILFPQGHVGGAVTAVSTGTAALELALLALELPPGAKVLVPALTFVATATAVLRAGFQPVFADVDAACWSLTPELARQQIRRMACDAVMPVSTFGRPQNTADWDRFSEETGLPVVIDAAGAFGNQGVGRRAVVCFSLHATKSLPAAEGGLVCAGSPDVPARVRKLSNFGIDPELDWKVGIAGSNAKLSEYHAAVGLAALDQWPAMIEARHLLRQRYIQRLRSLGSAIELQAGTESGVYPTMVIRLAGGVLANEAVRALAVRGVEARRWYCPTLDRHPAFRDCAADALSVAHRLAEELIGLPYSLDMTDDQVERVVDSLKAMGVN